MWVSVAFLIPETNIESILLSDVPMLVVDKAPALSGGGSGAY